MVCGKEGDFLCETCKAGLEKASPVCPECGRASFKGWTHPRCAKKFGLDGLEAVYSYRDEKVRKIVEAIKFGFNRELIGRLSQEVKPVFEFDLVVPVPLFRYRLNWRGFNQAEEIGKLLVGGEGKMINFLMRVKNTKQQAKLKSQRERKENVKGAFALNTPLCRGSDISPLRKGRVDLNRVLLVDDVFTTGESMKECGRVLKRAGAKEVWGWALAQ